MGPDVYLHCGHVPILPDEKKLSGGPLGRAEHRADH